MLSTLINNTTILLTHSNNYIIFSTVILKCVFNILFLLLFIYFTVNSCTILNVELLLAMEFVLLLNLAPLNTSISIILIPCVLQKLFILLLN